MWFIFYILSLDADRAESEESELARLEQLCGGHQTSAAQEEAFDLWSVWWVHPPAGHENCMN